MEWCLEGSSWDGLNVADEKSHRSTVSMLQNRNYHITSFYAFFGHLVKL